jgi:transcription elongation factor GreA
MNGMPAAIDGEEALLVTADGYRQLRSELEMLQSDARTEMSERLREARQDGRLADNPALFELLEDQAQLEQQIAILEGQVAAAQIVAPVTNGRAEIGSCVRVRDLAVGEVAEFELGGLIESDLGKGRVSVGSPVGRALVGRTAGEIVEVETPRGTVAFEILNVRVLGRAPSMSRRAA